MNQETKVCKNCKKEFSVEPERKAFYERMAAPIPQVCVLCLWQQQMTFWPFGRFHKRTCDLTGEKLISIFPPKTRFPVYKYQNWISDEWTRPEITVDLNRSFFDQLYELQSKTPRPHQFGTNNTNSDYCDDVWESKNCYLSRSFTNCENISYSYRAVRCRDSYDLVYCYDTEQSYDCVYGFKIFNIKHSFDVRDSFDSAFLYDCRNVRNCFMCWNLRNKDYHILNQPYTKEEYETKLKEYRISSWTELEKAKRQFQELVRDEAVHKINTNVKTSNCTGNYLTECKNLLHSFFFETSDDCANVIRGISQKTSWDSTGLWNGELILSCVNTERGYNLRYGNYCVNCTDSEYLDYCIDCENCFGCVGLKKKKHCILNKQYEPEEYKELNSRIKVRMMQDGEYGEYLPYKMAPIGYNLSLLASTYFPETKESVEKLGGTWDELENTGGSVALLEPSDDIGDVDESIVKYGIKCLKTGRPFNITKDELDFLKRHGIPVPRYYPDVRTSERYKKLADIRSREAKCFFCQKPITHYYPLEWGYKKIACTECYQSQVI